MNKIFLPISYGELLDKISILEVKLIRIQDPKKRENIINERLAILESCYKQEIDIDRDLLDKLKEVNLALWDILQAQRDEEKKQELGAKFISLSIAVHEWNDKRFELKTIANQKSDLIEEKHYY